MKCIHFTFIWLQIHHSSNMLQDFKQHGVCLDQAHIWNTLNPGPDLGRHYVAVWGI